MLTLIPSPFLAHGNRALRDKQYERAIQFYVQALQAIPYLSNILLPNIDLALKRHLSTRNGQPRKRVAVCGCELAHNAGRVYTLAKLYDTFADVEIIGSIFPTHGRAVWAPLQNAKLPCHTFVVDDPCHFVKNAIELVLAHPYDIIHLSKPRAPNIIFGILYKLIWGSKVLVDIDDEELAFVKAEAPVNFYEYLKAHGTLPELKNLSGKDWTCISVDLVQEFDGVTVSNSALQQRYGGEIIRHAQDIKNIQPTQELKERSRKKHGIPLDKKVILFFGAPRQHKGLEEIVDAIASLKRDDLILVIVGDFLNSNLRAKLQAHETVQCIFIGGDAFKEIEQLTAIGDCCILPQHNDADISAFQVPVKLTEALASGLAVIVNGCPPVMDVIAEGAVIPIYGSLSDIISKTINGEIDVKKLQVAAKAFYQSEMTVSVNRKRLEQAVKSILSKPKQISHKLRDAITNFADYTSFPVAAMVSNVPVLEKRELSGHKAISPPKPAAVIEGKRQPPLDALLAPVKKLPITVLVITWDIGHNPLGRSYMLAEVVQRIARHSLLIGFQFPRYGNDVWEPVRDGKLPVISLPGADLPEFHESLQAISKRIRPDVVIACKPRLPSVELGIMIKEQWGCPLIVDVDDHELSFFKNQTEVQLSQLASLPAGSASTETEPFGELWTRLTQNLCKSADEIIVSNIALQREFGGTIVPHVRDENTFDPKQYNGLEVRRRYGVPDKAKVVLFFGTPRVHKGVDILAQAVNRIADQEFRLLVVGTAPDRSVTAKLDAMAPGRVLYLPNQPFHAIPEILSMADVVCLPQDEGHAISKYQLPAKAIDAIAMGVPLLVSNTPPLMQLVEDRVAELVDTKDIAAALERLGGNSERVHQWRKDVRSRFLSRYSYAAAAAQMQAIIQRCLTRKQLNPIPDIRSLINASRHVLGLAADKAAANTDTGIDIVLFWKQNDTGLYGRRHDMVIKYLSSRPDVRKVIVFDAPISEFDLIKKQQATHGSNQDRWIYVGTYKKMLGVYDTEKISYNVFVYPPGKFRNNSDDTVKPHMHEGYFPYISQVLKREGVEPSRAIFWIYPKNYSAPDLIKEFKPAKTVVDVVDDHRAWPDVSALEKKRLTQNYKQTLAMADLVLTNCEPVKESMKEFHFDVKMIPNGCDSTPPISIPVNSSEYNSLCQWKGKVIGYIGNLESKIDTDLIKKIALRFNDCLVVLVGSTHTNPDILQLKQYPNIRMPGVVPYLEAGAWVSKFDVGLVPHLNTDLTKNMNPLKIFVYLSHNVPVVSTEISNIERNSELVKVAPNHDEFIEAVSALLLKGKQKNELSSTYVKENSWEARLSDQIDKLHSELNNMCERPCAIKRSA
jgi:glycosyltransferase involved in cell wall biosynthesis